MQRLQRHATYGHLKQLARWAWLLRVMAGSMCEYWTCTLMQSLLQPCQFGNLTRLSGALALGA